MGSGKETPSAGLSERRTHRRTTDDPLNPQRLSIHRGRGGRNARKKAKNGYTLNWNPHYIVNWKALAVTASSALAVLLAVAGSALYRGNLRYDLSRGSAPILLREIERLNQLVTVKYTVSRIVSLTEPKTPFGEESILLMVEGQALAGVDLTCLTVSDLDFSHSRSVTVRLPRAKLLNVFLNEKRTKVWDRRITWWTPWVPYDPDLEHKARLSALADVRTAALDMGILMEAQRNAEESIANFLHASGMEVSFKAG